MNNSDDSVRAAGSAPVATDREMEDRLKVERLTVIGHLTGRLSGELRQPLSVIRNAIYFLNMQLSMDTDDRVRRHLALMLRELDNISLLVGNIANLGARIPSERRLVDVEVLVGSALERLPIPAGVEVRTALKPEARVFGDPMQLKLAIANLVMNSAQAMEHGGRVNVVCRQTEKEVMISVTDNGPGMTPEVRARIFEPLFTTSEHRLGLGMTIVRHMVGANGGRIAVKSEPGKGTTVTLTFHRPEP